MVDLTHLADRDVNNLSGGERQRAVIARALASEAEFLYSMSRWWAWIGITSCSAQTLGRFCHDHNKTILMISHDVAAMRQTAHRMIYLGKGFGLTAPRLIFRAWKKSPVYEAFKMFMGAITTTTLPNIAVEEIHEASSGYHP